MVECPECCRLSDRCDCLDMRGGVRRRRWSFWIEALEQPSYSIGLLLAQPRE